jgi:hypothetical protein
MKNKILTALFCVLTACQMEKESPLLTENQQNLQVQIPISRLPLFADLSEYALSSESLQTKTGSETVTLESLLDLSSMETSSWKEDISFTQIPFIQNEETNYVAILSQDETVDKATRVKKFLIIKDTAGRRYSFVVTLVADWEYYKYHEDFDFLNRPNFTGIALFSSIEGKLLMMRAYKGGLICPATAIKPEDTTLTDSTQTEGYIAVYDKSLSTKTDGEWITPSYCTAFRYLWLTPSYCIEHAIYFDGTAWHVGMNNAGGGGISGGGGNDLSGDELPEEDFPDEERFTVELSHYSAIEYIDPDAYFEAVQMLGSGNYLNNTQVVIDYLSLCSPLILTFSYWTGDFEGVTCDMPFLITVKGDIQSTAYFDTEKPCSDETNRITNPLVNMSIAASSSWGNYKGGTYGNTRRYTNGTLKWHDGIDLLAQIGTPVYAVYSGFVTSIVQHVPDNLQRGFGNEIIITSERDDNTDIILRYAHLQSGNAIAINPRTGSRFTTGDRVNRGDIIGYTGRSGNAYNVPNKHLHLGVQIRSESGVITSVNPADYINGTINVNTINSTNGRIDNIICDD